MKALIVYLIGIFCSISIVAQDEVTGVVFDVSGKPVKNVKMRLTGLIKSNKTNSKGAFHLRKILKNDTLMVYPTDDLVAKIPLRPNTFLSLQLNKHFVRCTCDSSTISYMYQPAPKITYSSNIITQRQIIEYAPNSLIELLRGKIAGLQIQQMDGTAKASIRGVSSMSLNTEPLFIIGGTQYETLESANNAVSVEDIKEVEVKKDGSEYGMKGANGVIIIRIK